MGKYHLHNPTCGRLFARVVKLVNIRVAHACKDSRGSREQRGFIHPDCYQGGNISVRIIGSGNRVRIGRPKNPTKTSLSIKLAGRSSLDIADEHQIQGARIFSIKGGSVTIGSNVTVRSNLRLLLHEASNITVGDDCLFASDVWYATSDMHSILDLETMERINPARDIAIGSHVWIGIGVKILKGTKVGNDSIIGAGAVVRGTLPENVIAAGNPAQVQRKGVTWGSKL